MKKAEESILKGVLAYSISTWANVILGFLSIIVLTRVLKPEVYGEIMLFLSATQVLLYVVTLGFDVAYIRFFNEPPSADSPSQLLYKNLTITSLFCVICAVCSLLLPSDITEKVLGFGGKLIIGLLFLNTFTQVILRFLNIAYRMSFQTAKYNIQNILMNSVTRLFIVIGAVICNKTEFILLVLTLGLIIVLIVYFYLQKNDIRPVAKSGQIDYSISLKGYRSYIRFALLGAPTYIVTYLNTFLGQQIISVSLGTYYLGIFTSTGAFSAILAAVKGGFSTFWSAYTYKNYTSDNERIAKMHDVLVCFTLVVTNGLVLFRDVIYLFIGEAYHDSKCFFSILLLYPILSLVQETTDKGIAISKKNEIALIVHVVAVVVNLILCHLLIPRMAILGAAYANGFSAISLFVLSTFYGQKYYKTINNKGKSLMGIIAIIILLFIPSFVSDMKWIILSSFVVNIIVFSIYRKELSYLVSVVKMALNKIRHQ